MVFDHMKAEEARELKNRVVMRLQSALDGEDISAGVENICKEFEEEFGGVEILETVIIDIIEVLKAVEWTIISRPKKIRGLFCLT